MKVLIIEDELPAQRMLSTLLDELDHEILVVGVLDSVKSSINWLKTNPHPEIILLDIQLSDGISFEILDAVEIESMIIFTTAFDEYAIQAFKVNSIDYLLKPIEKKDLEQSLEKYQVYSKKFIQNKNKEIDYQEIVSLIKTAEPAYRRRFLIQSNESFFQIPVSDIAYFYSMLKITFAVTFKKREYPLDYSLESLREQLDPNQFFKINRQVIVNIDAIVRVHAYFQSKLKLETDPPHSEEIIIGKDKAASFKRWLDR